MNMHVSDCTRIPTVVALSLLALLLPTALCLRWSTGRHENSVIVAAGLFGSLFNQLLLGV